MDKDALKDILYGGLSELIKNNQYYYHSNIGPNYSHWTEEGSKALAEYMHMIAELIFIADFVSLDKRAKELVINGLTGK